MRTRDRNAAFQAQRYAVSAIAIAIVTSSVTSDVKYITLMTSNVKYVQIYI